MAAPTLIRRVVVEGLDIALKKPFGIAGGAQARAANALVTVELEDGTQGFGEAAPFPAFNGETQTGAIAAVLRPLGAGTGSARCAIETAVLDALTKHAGLPLWSFFGGAARSLATDITITTGSIAEARAEATAFTASGFSRLKVKIGAGTPEDDVARVVAIHEAAPGAGLILDGNGGLSGSAALAVVEALGALGIKPILLEQPVHGDDWEGLIEVSRKAGVPVAADESVATAADALRIAQTGAAQVINIKLMKSGVVEAMAIAEVARAAGLGLMIGG